MLSRLTKWLLYCSLQESSSAQFTATVALDHLVWDWPHLVPVVPAQLLPTLDVGAAEERYPGEPEIMSVHKHVLNEHVGIAAVVHVSSDVASLHGVHDVSVPLLIYHIPHTDKVLCTLSFRLWWGDFSLCFSLSLGLSLLTNCWWFLGLEWFILVTWFILTNSLVTVFVTLNIQSLGILHNFNKVQLCKVLISEVPAHLVTLLTRVETTNIDTDECSSRNIVQGSQSPASVCCLEHLEITSRGILSNSVVTRSGARTSLVAFVDASSHIALNRQH